MNTPKICKQKIRHGPQRKTFREISRKIHVDQLPGRMAIRASEVLSSIPNRVQNLYLGKYLNMTKRNLIQMKK